MPKCHLCGKEISGPTFEAHVSQRECEYEAENRKALGQVDPEAESSGEDLKKLKKDELVDLVVERELLTAEEAEKLIKAKLIELLEETPPEE